MQENRIYGNEPHDILNHVSTWKCTWDGFQVEYIAAHKAPSASGFLRSTLLKS